MSAPTFVAIGHVTLDYFGDRFEDRGGDRVRLGGSALYAAVTAHRLGLSAGILTSHGNDFPLEAIPTPIEVVSVPSDTTTSFRHVPLPRGRRRMSADRVASPLSLDDLPADWRDAPLVLLAPVIDEVDPLLATAFADATVGAAAQGWLRARAAEGTISPASWKDSHLVISRIQALFVSIEDIQGPAASTVELFQQVPVGVVTAADLGALLFVNGERYEVRPHLVREVDATGAGDVFAAAFMLSYEQNGDGWEASTQAACAAALSVEGDGLSAIPDATRLAAAVRQYRRGLA